MMINKSGQAAKQCFFKFDSFNIPVRKRDYHLVDREEHLSHYDISASGAAMLAAELARVRSLKQSSLRNAAPFGSHTFKGFSLYLFALSARTILNKSSRVQG